jgi:hypothetical protein
VGEQAHTIRHELKLWRSIMIGFILFLLVVGLVAGFLAGRSFPAATR